MRRRANILRILLPAALSGLILACSTVGSRIRQHQTAYDASSPEVQRKIRAGEADIGFTREQAVMALGRPDRVFTNKTSPLAQEIWAYGFESGPHIGFGFGMATGGPVVLGTGVALEEPIGTRGARLRMIFENGIVTRIERCQGY